MVNAQKLIGPHVFLISHKPALPSELRRPTFDLCLTAAAEKRSDTGYLYVVFECGGWDLHPIPVLCILKKDLDPTSEPLNEGVSAFLFTNASL